MDATVVLSYPSPLQHLAVDGVCCSTISVVTVGMESSGEGKCRQLSTLGDKPLQPVMEVGFQRVAHAGKRLSTLGKGHLLG